MATTATDDRAHHRRRFSGRDPGEQHRASTPLELLYDLTIVVAFGAAANEMAHFVAEDHVCGRRRRVRLRLLRRHVGVAELLVVRLRLRHRRLGLPPRDDRADGRRDRARARAAADVRVARPRRDARQPRDGGRLRRHARAAAVPLVAGLAPRPAAAAHRAHLHASRRRRAGRLGRAGDRRAPGRADAGGARAPRRARDGRPARRGAQGAARRGTRTTSPSATGCW